MTDLPDRILAAIAEDRRNAEELKAVQPELMRIGLSTSDGRSLVVSSDPDVILRHCEADKRTVQRHSHVGHSVPFGDYELDYCRACGNLIPCPDLLDRASAYDIEAP